jgi:hypothetical protein
MKRLTHLIGKNPHLIKRQCGIRLRAIENRAYSLRNPPAWVQFQPTSVGWARRCARIAFAVAYPEFMLIKVTLSNIFTRRPQ